jgi:16S rRNA (uracil1498-N3)-methyltransferase
MQRFFLPSLDQSRKQFLMEDCDEVHHITRVLRLTSGDEIELINGCGLLARARIGAVTKQRIEGELLLCVQKPRVFKAGIVLVCALSKNSKFDDIIEQCTELGVDEFVPVVTARTEVVPSKEALCRMNDRFNRIVVSASKQCQRLWFPVLHPVMKFESAVDLMADKGNTLFFPWLEGKRVLLKEALANAESVPAQDGSLVFFIGPEGDFTFAEGAYALNKGAIPVSLGETVLRVATAAVAVTAFARFMKER